MGVARAEALTEEALEGAAQIPVGHVLEVITRDASAKEDLPSMARLLGHAVRSVETEPDGRDVEVAGPDRTGPIR